MVDMYTLLYKKVAGPLAADEAEDWTTVSIPGSGYHQTVQDNSWILTNLSAASSYECIVQAHNVYGWSSPSPIFVFQTSDQLDRGQSSKQNWDNSPHVSNIATRRDCFSAFITFMI